MEQGPQYRFGYRSSGDSGVDGFDEDTDDHRAAPYKLRQSVRTDDSSRDSVPLFLSDSDGEPDPSEYITPLMKKRRASISSRILAGVCVAAAAAVLAALISSDATQYFVVNVKASMAAVFPASSAAAQAESPRLTVRDSQKGPVRASATADQRPVAPGFPAVATTPAREEIKLAYQNALQGLAPAAAPVAEPAKTESAPVHHLDPDAIAALLKRADALIASSDVAAARLVLRRAADAGDADAATKLAETYDPAILEKLGVHGVVPDRAMARSWYEKARSLGSVEAPRRLEMLASKPQ